MKSQYAQRLDICLRGLQSFDALLADDLPVPEAASFVAEAEHCVSELQQLHYSSPASAEKAGEVASAASRLEARVRNEVSKLSAELRKLRNLGDARPVARELAANVEVARSRGVKCKDRALSDYLEHADALQEVRDELERLFSEYQRTSSKEWLKDARKQLLGGWFSSGLRHRFRKLGYDRGVQMVEEFAADIEAVSEDFDNLDALRKQILVEEGPPDKYDSCSLLFFSAAVDGYRSRCLQLQEIQEEKFRKEALRNAFASARKCSSGAESVSGRLRERVSSSSIQELCSLLRQAHSLPEIDNELYLTCRAEAVGAVEQARRDAVDSAYRLLDSCNTEGDRAYARGVFSALSGVADVRDALSVLGVHCKDRGYLDREYVVVSRFLDSLPTPSRMQKAVSILNGELGSRKWVDRIESFRSFVASADLSLEESGYVREVCEGLSAAASNGSLSHDVKYGNLPQDLLENALNEIRSYAG